MSQAGRFRCQLVKLLHWNTCQGKRLDDKVQTLFAKEFCSLQQSQVLASLQFRRSAVCRDLQCSRKLQITPPQEIQETIDYREAGVDSCGPVALCQQLSLPGEKGVRPNPLIHRETSGEQVEAVPIGLDGAGRASLFLQSVNIAVYFFLGQIQSILAVPHSVSPFLLLDAPLRLTRESRGKSTAGFFGSLTGHHHKAAVAGVVAAGGERQ